MRITCGIGSTQVARASEEERKSMSTEQTFGELSQPAELFSKCLELSRLLAEDLAKEQLKGKTISLKLKTTDFQVRTRAQTISNYTSDADVIFSVAKGILRNEILAESPRPLRLRLMGVRISKLVSESECPQEKQNTILGFFKKTPDTSSDKSPFDHQTQTFSVSSSDNYHHKVCAGDSFESPSWKTSDVQELEINQQTEEASSSENVEQGLVFADHTDDFMHGDKMDACDVPVAYKGERDDQIYETGLQGTDRQLASCTEMSHKMGPDMSDETSDKNEGTSTDCHVLENQEGELNSEIPELQNNLSSVAVAKTKSDAPVPESVAVDTSSLRHSHSSAVDSVPTTSYACDWDDKIRSDAEEVGRDTPIHSFDVREPFTCPVCCKPVGCINLTDFNAHIDKCLQPQSQQPSTSVTKSSSSNKPSASQATTQKSKSSRNSSNKNSPGANTSAQNKKVKHASNAISKLASDNASSTDSGAGSSRAFRGLDEIIPGSELTEGGTPGIGPDHAQQKNFTCAEAGSIDYMVCPLCGAERADWTLDTFNQHVDTCLNRDTISQILREQQANEGPSRKRPAAGQQAEHKAPQPTKKTKVNQSPKTERSILSFFKR